MHKVLISIIMIGLSSIAHAGIWAKQGGGSSGAGAGCYLVVFPTKSYGTQQLIGIGIFGTNTFSGFLKFAQNQDSANTGHPGLRVCGSSGDCAWEENFNRGAIASVSGLPIISAVAIGCY